DLINASPLPLMAAPMFLVSGPELTIACARAGVIGGFPAPNVRNVEALVEWMEQTRDGVREVGPQAAWSLNMIVHRSYDRFERELELVREYQPRIVSTALGSPKRVL